MNTHRETVLQLLKTELAFLNSGGYKHYLPAPWRAAYIFEESLQLDKLLTSRATLCLRKLLANGICCPRSSDVSKFSVDSSSSQPTALPWIHFIAVEL